MLATEDKNRANERTKGLADSKRALSRFRQAGWRAARKCAGDCGFTHRSFLRNMALSHAIPFRNIAAPSGWVWFDKSVRRPPVRAPINMTDQNRASASSVPHRLFDPVL
ncbi:hypothetical protein [Paraburkholderia sp. ZP32-5]|uniref:hypothetical protein n=1 Tax=Paraburkholderia sp. ZP32-5 TaxID=2883245 RepID=UPI001F3B3820|nr:hypothetical protein [Paraburkholderia sp. ZP32-5]